MLRAAGENGAGSGRGALRGKAVILNKARQAYPLKKVPFGQIRLSSFTILPGSVS